MRYIAHHNNYRRTCSSHRHTQRDTQTHTQTHRHTHRHTHTPPPVLLMKNIITMPTQAHLRHNDHFRTSHSGRQNRIKMFNIDACQDRVEPQWRQSVFLSLVSVLESSKVAQKTTERQRHEGKRTPRAGCCISVLGRKINYWANLSLDAERSSRQLRRGDGR